MKLHAVSPDEVALPESLLRRLDTPGPRYTAYPTADRFVEAFGPDEYRQALRQRAGGAVVGGSAPLSLYVHIPFCESVCYHCACNKIVTRRHERGRAYLQALATEIDLHTAELGRGQVVSQLHLGGGSPTFLSDHELSDLIDMLRGAFLLSSQAEVSIEVDPRTADRQRLQHLSALGFNRISFGIQGFDPAVQTAVNRVQSFDSVQALINQARELGFRSINADLVYGLPMQTPASFQRTIAQVVELRPHRIALYAYTHLPERFKPQRRISAADLPRPEHRLRMLGSAMACFIGQGYAHIGLDHFALPGDALAVAKRQGRLHRNLQGYSTHPDGDLIGLGVSSVGRVGATYSQNARTLSAYNDALSQGRFPVQRGLALTRDDLLRRSVIMALMCQGRLDFESIDLAHLVDTRSVLAPELARLRPLVDLGLVEISAQAVQVTPTGWYGVRAVAMVFDRYLRADADHQRLSRVL